MGRIALESGERGHLNLETRREIPEYDALIVGGGPGGCGGVISLLDAARQLGKNLRIGVIDTKGLGGEIGNYDISGNSTPCEVLEGLEGTSVEEALNDDSARRIRERCNDDPTGPAQLPEVGDFYNHGLSIVITKLIGQDSIIRETVSRIVLRSGQYVLLNSDEEEIAKGHNIILATGAHEEIIPEMQPFSDKLVFSTDIFTKSRNEEIRAILERLPLEQRLIAILGNSHGAWAGVNRILKDFGDLLPEGGIRVFAHHDTKVYFKSQEEAQAAGYSFSQDEVSPTTGEINPFGGIKHDSKLTYLKTIAGEEPRVNIVRYHDFEEVRPLFETSSVIIQAAGLSTNLIKIFNDQGIEIGPLVEKGKVKMSKTAQILDLSGNVLPGAYGIGVGYDGFLRPDDKKREPIFTGSFFGTTSYRRMVAPSIAEQITIPLPIREFNSKLLALGLRLPMTEQVVAGRNELFIQTSSEQFDPQKDTVLIAIAHPDDEEFVGATIRKLRKRGKQVVVVALTNGCAGANLDTQSTVTETRKAEAIEAMRRLDVNIYVNLGFTDGLLIHQMDEAERRLTQYVRVIDPEVMIGHKRKDYHSDHRAASEITEAALFKARNAIHLEQGVPQSSKNPAYYEMDPQGLRTRRGKLAKVDMVVRVRESDLKERSHAFEAHESQVFGLSPDGKSNYVQKSTTEARSRGRTGGYTWGEGLTQPSWGGEEFTSKNILGDWLGRGEYRNIPRDRIRRGFLQAEGFFAGARQIF